MYVGKAVRTDGRADSPLTVERRRELGGGILEDITIHNHALQPAVCDVALFVDTDFAELFEVKDGRASSFEHAAVRPERKVSSSTP
jgi:hypothetical protein